MRRYTLEKTLPLRLIVVDTDNNMIDTRSFTLKYTLATSVVEGEHEVTTQMGQNISVAKINFFIDNYLNNSIALDAEFRAVTCARFAEYENNYLVLPDLTESTLMEVLHCKLNSLCKPGSRVDVIQLYDMITEMSYTFYQSEDDEYDLPDQNDWMGPLSFWPDPWWRRTDVSTYDNAAKDTEELEQWRVNLSESSNYQMAMRAFEDIEEMVKNSFRDALEQAGVLPKVERGQLIEVDFVNDKEPAKRERWTPKLI